MKGGLLQFNQSARKILTLAHAEAEKLGHRTIEQEHILLALVQVDGAAGDLLREQGANIEAVRQIVDRLMPESQKSSAKGRTITLGESTQRTLERVVEIAGRYSHNFIAPEHIMLAITLQPEARIKEIMKESGLDPDHIREETELLIQKLQVSQELDDLLETLHLCRDLLLSEKDFISRERLQRIEQILKEYFKGGVF
jgi:ATP-dependent Clp protease ATP-binding subunit ClpC